MSAPSLSWRQLLLVLSWLPVVYTVHAHGVLVTQIHGALMAPALNPDTHRDTVVVRRAGVRKSLAVGDVVVFTLPTDPSMTYAKRVVAVGGDEVATRHPCPKPLARVPRNHVWVEGDNMSRLVDSNHFGPISTGLVRGRCEWVVWPPSRWGAVPAGGREARVRMIQEV